MPTPDEEVRSNLKIVLGELETINAASLARLELGAGLTFESGVVDFSRTLRLFHSLNESDVTDVPYATVRGLLDVATATRDRLAAIQTFSLQANPSNPIGVRDELRDAIGANYQNGYNVIAPVAAFTIRKGTDFKRLEDDAKARLVRITERSSRH